MAGLDKKLEKAVHHYERVTVRDCSPVLEVDATVKLESSTSGSSSPLCHNPISTLYSNGQGASPLKCMRTRGIKMVLSPIQVGGSWILQKWATTMPSRLWLHLQLTKDEEQRQFFLQLVDQHRQNHPGTAKSSLANPNWWQWVCWLCMRSSLLKTIGTISPSDGHSEKKCWQAFLTHSTSLW